MTTQCQDRVTYYYFVRWPSGNNEDRYAGVQVEHSLHTRMNNLNSIIAYIHRSENKMTVNIFSFFVFITAEFNVENLHCSITFKSEVTKH